MGNYTIFRCSKSLGEAGEQEILQKMFRKFEISDRLPNRYFPKIDVGCPCLVIGELIFTLFFILNMASLDSSHRASKSRKNADMGG